MFNETVEVAKWIPILALVYILFLQGLLLYVVRLCYRERLRQMAIKPNTANAPKNDKHDENVIKCRTRNESA